eukprot:TRINITY_DN2736_c0_g1_i1.p1 TRINITY_DN2736_c0_g1~~TRINITY_DN2736_c0_g1_i1.p1  ORF type:complete len:323 (-),score=60.97 TRINITY_DN2736_c0_g1_i1:5-952(-)
MDIAPTFVFRGLHNPVHSVALSEGAETNSGTVYTGDSEGTITAFDLGTRREVEKWEAMHYNSVISLWVNSGQMCSQGRDGRVKTWDIQTGHVLSELNTGTSNFCKTSFAASSSLGDRPLAACTTISAREVKVWDLRDSKVICELGQFEDKLGMCMSLNILSPSSSDTHVCVGYENGGIYFWDLKMNKVAFELDTKLKEPVISTAFDHRYTEGIMGGAGTEVVKFKVTWKKGEVEETKEATLPKQGINELGVRRDKKIVVGAGWDHRIRLWQWKDLKPLGALKYHNEGVSSVVLSKVDNMMISGGQDAKLAIWNIY